MPSHVPAPQQHKRPSPLYDNEELLQHYKTTEFYFGRTKKIVYIYLHRSKNNDFFLFFLHIFTNTQPTTRHSTAPRMAGRQRAAPGHGAEKEPKAYTASTAKTCLVQSSLLLFLLLFVLQVSAARSTTIHAAPQPGRTQRCRAPHTGDERFGTPLT